MSIEMKNGEFSENMDYDTALTRFQNMMKNDSSKLKALHVGTEKELDEIKGEPNLQKQIDKLSDKIDSIEGVRSDFIDIPTKEQIKSFG